MVRWAMRGMMIVACLGAAGCNNTPPSPEVPSAGPAAAKEADPGPAPDGQSEPEETAAQGDSATAPEAAAEPQTSTATDDGVHLVAYREGAAPAGDVAVTIQDWKKTEALIASHKGKVVVVDMWSLSCDPCRREFPHLVKLHNDKPGSVACISVSTDYAGIKSKPPEFYKAKVLEFLTQQKATFDNVLCSVDSETLFDDLGLASIPAVFVYDKNGKMVQKFAGEEVHYDKEVVPLVEQLLAK